MKRIFLKIILILISIYGFAIGQEKLPYCFLPKDIGIVVLRAVEIKEHKVSIKVNSSGCTDNKTIEAKIVKKDGVDKEVPHYEITFIRNKPDNCKAFLPEGIFLEYDVQKDLNIKMPYTLSILNPIIPILKDESFFDIKFPKEVRPVSSDESELKKALINAVVKAIEMEIKRNENRLKVAESGVGPKENVERFKAKIEELKSELEKFKNMKSEDYSLPQGEETEINLEKMRKFGPLIPPLKKEVKVTVETPYRSGSVLDIDRMTKSGPFYHVAGIKGDDLNILKVGKRYQLLIYLVYKREYFGLIPDYYVYIAEFREE